MDVIRIIIGYFIIINFIGFFTFGLDKYKARKNLWRIPEATLFILAIIGGSIGALIGMYSFRHKTRHWYFVTGIPTIILIQILLIILLIKSPLQIGIM